MHAAIESVNLQRKRNKKKKDKAKKGKKKDKKKSKKRKKSAHGLCFVQICMLRGCTTVSQIPRYFYKPSFLASMAGESSSSEGDDDDEQGLSDNELNQKQLCVQPGGTCYCSEELQDVLGKSW